MLLIPRFLLLDGFWPQDQNWLVVKMGYRSFCLVTDDGLVAETGLTKRLLLFSSVLKITFALCASIRIEVKTELKMLGMLQTASGPRKKGSCPDSCLCLPGDKRVGIGGLVLRNEAGTSPRQRPAGAMSRQSVSHCQLSSTSGN